MVISHSIQGLSPALSIRFCQFASSVVMLISSTSFPKIFSSYSALVLVVGTSSVLSDVDAVSETRDVSREISVKEESAAEVLPVSVFSCCPAALHPADVRIRAEQITVKIFFCITYHSLLLDDTHHIP